MNYINEKTVRSDLQMKDIYFSKIECLQNKDLSKLGEVNLKTNYKVDIKDINEDEKEILFEVQIFSEDERLAINLVANGIFKLEGVNLSKEEKDIVFRHNAVAIMFPFIRSQVALITAQPGLNSVMLQPINTTKIWNKE